MNAVGVSQAEEFSATFPDPIQATVTYRRLASHEIKADLYRTPDDRRCPVVVWIHGGALMMGHREQVHREVKKLAAQRGYALLSIDYRLAPETELPEIISDLDAAFQWIEKEGAGQFHLNPKRIAFIGGSAGGYLTLTTGYRVQPWPKALVAFYGYGDLTGDWCMKPSPHPRHHRIEMDAKSAAAQSGGTVVSDARKRRGNGGLIYLHARQTGTWPQRVSGFGEANFRSRIVAFEPRRHVSVEYPPILLIHGTEDSNVPHEQSLLMAQALRQYGVPQRLISLENGEHGFGGG